MGSMTIAVYLALGICLAVPVLALVVILAVMLFKLLKTDASSMQLFRSGVSAPADIISAKVGTATSTTNSLATDKQKYKRYRVHFVVNVQPVNDSPFQAEFDSLVDEGEAERIPTEKKIWVRYDPNNHSKVAFEETDGWRTQRIKNENMIHSVSDYWQLDAKRYIPLRTSGTRCPAVILQREKIMEAGGPAIYRFLLEVTPQFGMPYKTKSHLLVQDEKRFSVGDKVFVRFDPKDPTFVAIENF